jgi:hypothetical protein
MAFKAGDIVRVKPNLARISDNPNPGTIGRVISKDESGLNQGRYSVEFQYSERLQKIFTGDMLHHFPGERHPKKYMGFHGARWSYPASALEHYAWGEGRKSKEMTEEEKKFVEEIKNKEIPSPVDIFLVDSIESSLNTGDYTEEDFRI